MPSRAELLLIAVLLVAAPSLQAAERVTAAQVEAAASALRADPRLSGGHRTERVLRLKPSEPDEKKPPVDLSAWRRFSRWLSEATRALAWVLGAFAVVSVIVLWRRWMQVRATASPDGVLVLPSHVRDLDIRPDSLPDDIGRAARELWLAGDQRAALSLLYRGALSRLVHAHAVPIAASSTEGECVRQARLALPAASGEFVARLVGLWQRSVYGGQAAPSAGVMDICNEFEAHLPRRASPT